MTIAEALNRPIVPAIAALCGAGMMFLPHPYGSAPALAILAFSFTRSSWPAAVLLVAAAAGGIAYAGFLAGALAKRPRAGNAAAAVLFAVFALVFFMWQAGPFIG